MDVIPDDILPSKPPRVWSGWLYKKCKQAHTRWVRRYFRLELVKLYYSTNDTSKVRKDIDLDGCEIIDEKHKKYPFYFRIHYEDPKRRDYHIYAESLLAKRGWISAINGAIKRMNKSDIFSRSAASSLESSSPSRSTSSETDSGANFSDEDDESDSETENSTVNGLSTEVESYTKDGVESNGTMKRRSVPSLGLTALGNSDSMVSDFGGGQSSIHSPASSTGFQDIIEEDKDPFFESANSSKEKSSQNEDGANIPNFSGSVNGEHRFAPKLSTLESKDIGENDRSATHSTKIEAEVNDFQNSEGDDGLRQVEETLKLDLRLQDLKLSLQQEWASREAVLNEEISRLKSMLDERSENKYKPDPSFLDSKENELGGNINRFNRTDPITTSMKGMPKSNTFKEQKKADPSDERLSMLELSLSDDTKKGFSNIKDEEKVVKSFLQRVSPQQGKSRRLATEYGNRVQPRASGRLGFSARRKKRSAFIKKTIAPSGITVSVRRANRLNKSKIHLDTIRKARKTRRRVSYMRYKNDAPKIRGQRDALYGSKTNYFRQKLKNHKREKGFYLQGDPNLSTARNEVYYIKEDATNQQGTHLNGRSFSSNQAYSMIVERQSRIDQANVDLGLSFNSSNF